MKKFNVLVLVLIVEFTLLFLIFFYGLENLNKSFLPVVYIFLFMTISIIITKILVYLSEKNIGRTELAKRVFDETKGSIDPNIRMIINEILNGKHERDS